MVLNNLYFCNPYKNSEETYSQMTDSIQYVNLFYYGNKRSNKSKP